jgi:hypothetical protein
MEWYRRREEDQMRWALYALASVLTSAIFVGGCAWHPLVPHSALEQAPTPESTLTQLGRPRALEVGVDLYAASGYSRRLVQRDGARTLSYIRRTLRADGVGIVWNLCSPSDLSARVHRCAGTLSPAAVGLLAAQARRDGLAVEMRPVIRVGPVSGWNNPHRSWEGFLNPGSQRAFFASLLRAETPYLQVARRYHAQAFVAASELQDLRASPFWAEFLRQVQGICGCAASYAWSNALHGAAAAGGLDAYPHLQLPATVSQARLDQAWVRWLGQFPRSALRQASIQEISIPAEDNAYRHPEDWNAVGQADPQVQARWFTAACRAAAYYNMRGIWFYEVPLTDDPAVPASFPSFFVGRPASETAIRSCRS